MKSRVVLEPWEYVDNAVDAVLFMWVYVGYRPLDRLGIGAEVVVLH